MHTPSLSPFNFLTELEARPVVNPDFNPESNFDYVSYAASHTGEAPVKQWLNAYCYPADSQPTSSLQFAFKGIDSFINRLSDSDYKLASVNKVALKNFLQWILLTTPGLSGEESGSVLNHTILGGLLFNFPTQHSAYLSQMKSAAENPNILGLDPVLCLDIYSHLRYLAGEPQATSNENQLDRSLREQLWSLDESTELYTLLSSFNHVYWRFGHVD